MIDQIAILLFKYIRRKRESTPKALAIKKGYELEDEVAKEIYTACALENFTGWRCSRLGHILSIQPSQV